MARRSRRSARRAGRHDPVGASWQLTVMGAAGISAGIVLGVLGDPVLGPLLGWDVAALIYLLWVWRIIWPMDAASTARLAVREDPNRALRDVLLLGACIASLVATGLVLTTAHHTAGTYRNLDIALGTVSVVLSWTVVHTVFTTRYARIYYTGPDGGIDFNQREPPRYSDFAYLSFTVGTTFQVSDTALTCTEMRTTVLRHQLLSYLFGAIIIAATVNLLAGLAG